MRPRPVSRWVFAWGLMLVAALVIGVVTRISYGDVSAHPETMDGLPYEVAPYSQERFEQYAKGMGDASTAQALSNAELVARVQKKASSIYRYKAFASEMRVMEVLRGDDCLQGVSIDVYEPVSLRDWGGTRCLVAVDAYQFGSTPMREDEEYVLFLNRAPHNRVVGDAWTLVVSPFAKIAADGNPTCMVHEGVGESMELRELKDADMVAESDRDMEAYLVGCEDVLRSLDVGR